MKICIFSKPFHPAVGGVEQIALTLAHEFSYSHLDVEVVTETKGDASDDSTFPFKITRTASFKNRYHSFRRADIILFMNFTFAGVPAALLSRRTIVLSHHGIYNSCSSLKVKLLELTKRQLTRFFSNISVSRFVAKNLPSTSLVIPNAYNDKLFIYEKISRDKDFVFCGRLVDEKGATVLLDAFTDVLKKHPDATLTIIGGGPEYSALLDKSRRISPLNINLLGVLRDEKLVAALKEHACMVIPSLCEEAFGIVALEGIASCDTVISSNKGGLPEAIDQCGILVAPNAYELTTAMLKVLQSRRNDLKLPGEPELKIRSEHLAKHSAKQIAQKYITALQQAAKR